MEQNTQQNTEQKTEQNIEQFIASGHIVRIKPQGFSMYPLLYPGRDEVLISRIEHRLKRGDVILYRRADGLLVLHRIYKVTASGIYTVGDNQTQIEGPLHTEQVKGILIDLFRKGHRISVKNPLYVFLTHLWLFLRPLRPFLSNLAHKLRTLCQK